MAAAARSGFKMATNFDASNEIPQKKPRLTDQQVISADDQVVGSFDNNRKTDLSQSKAQSSSGEREISDYLYSFHNLVPTPSLIGSIISSCLLLIVF